MATLLIPIRNDLPAYEFQLDLEGRLYNITIHYNSRMDRWIMDFYDEDENPILVGLLLLTDTDLLAQYVNDLLPPGDLYAVDESGEGKQPDRENFGNDIKLFYIESTT